MKLQATLGMLAISALVAMPIAVGALGRSKKKQRAAERPCI